MKWYAARYVCQDRHVLSEDSHRSCSRRRARLAYWINARNNEPRNLRLDH